MSQLSRKISDENTGEHNTKSQKNSRTGCMAGAGSGQQERMSHLGKGQTVVADHGGLGGDLRPEYQLLIQGEIEQGGENPGRHPGAGRQEKPVQVDPQEPVQQGEGAGIHHGAQKGADGVAEEVGQNQLIDPPGVVDHPEVGAFILLDVNGADFNLVKGDALGLIHTTPYYM